MDGPTYETVSRTSFFATYNCYLLLFVYIFLIHTFGRPNIWDCEQNFLLRRLWLLLTLVKFFFLNIYFWMAQHMRLWTELPSSPPMIATFSCLYIFFWYILLDGPTYETVTRTSFFAAYNCYLLLLKKIENVYFRKAQHIILWAELPSSPPMITTYSC